MSFFEKDEYSIADIQNLIDGKFEESLKLEFKRADALGLNNEKRRKSQKIFLHSLIQLAELSFMG